MIVVIYMIVSLFPIIVSIKPIFRPEGRNFIARDEMAKKFDLAFRYFSCTIFVIITFFIMYKMRV